MIIVSAAEMRELDRLTIEKYGVPSLTLMERAGESIASAILDRFADAAKRGVVVVAGKGNNGGDGFVVARLLKQRGIRSDVILLGRKDDASVDSKHNLAAFSEIGGKITELTDEASPRISDRFRGYGLLVDAILGTGMKHDVRGLFADVINSMNGSGLPIVAVDIPSGLDSDTGAPLGTAVKAAMTVSLGFAKIGEVLYPGIYFAGDLLVRDIGIDSRALEELAPKTFLLADTDVSQLIPVRRRDTHKGSYGHLLAIAGSRGKTGAAILACRAAMRSGAGLVTLAAPRSLNEILAGSLVEVMTEPLKETPAEEIGSLKDEEWRRLIERKDAVLFGPGVGVNEGTRNALDWLLRNLELPWIIDADGLNNLSLDVSRLRTARTAPVLTPHPGEMARLIGKDTATVNRDRIGVAREFAMENRCYLVLKGARSVIATAEGKVFINPTGNPGMASGGTGDVLAGILGSLLGQGFSPEDALKLAVYLHGFAGDRAASEKGEIGLIASDLIDALPVALRALSPAAI